LVNSYSFRFVGLHDSHCGDNGPLDWTRPGGGGGVGQDLLRSCGPARCVGVRDGCKWKDDYKNRSSCLWGKI